MRNSMATKIKRSPRRSSNNATERLQWRIQHDRILGKIYGRWVWVSFMSAG